MDYRLKGNLDSKDMLRLARLSTVKFEVLYIIFALVVILYGIFSRTLDWWLFAPLALALLLEIAIRYQARQQYKNGKLKYNIRITEKEIHAGNIEAVKENISKIRYRNDRIYLYINRKQVLILKKTWLHKSSDWDDFVEFIDKNYKNRK